MANNLIRFRETTSNLIQYHNWDLLDGGKEQQYAFSMSGFNVFEKWVHLVRIDRFNGTFTMGSTTSRNHCKTRVGIHEISCLTPFKVMVVVHGFKL